ncbi:hypothetical protein ACL02U_32095 [Streptomyces sp. MS06]|uniref:hypothetical protein n=1 Tax=Streptomyces sp. MS06 TaxID=3385974 RepID=UPI0039A2C9C5
MSLGTAGVAAAGQDGGVVYNPTGGASSWWKAYGDHYWVHDADADGHSAVGKLYVPYRGTVYNDWVTGGAGKSADFNYNLSEGADVYYKSCVGESGTGSIFSCNSDWYWAQA